MYIIILVLSYTYLWPLPYYVRMIHDEQHGYAATIWTLFTMVTLIFNGTPEQDSLVHYAFIIKNFVG